MASQAKTRVYYSAARVEAYTDAVIAIAATLLVLDLTSTAFGTVTSDAQMWAELGGMWPKFLSFGISFGLLSGIWVLHLRQFRDIAQVDLTLLWLNNARLLFIVMIPFTTSLVDEYSDFLAGRILLPINFFLAILFAVLTWSWAARNGGQLLKDDAKPDAGAETLGGVAAIVCGAAAVALSPWVGSWAFLAFAFSGVLTAVATRRRPRRPGADPSRG